jgi:hypothetical protein
LSKTAVELTTPPGRFVFGDLYEPETEDFDGNPLVIKNGVDKGKPTQLFVIGLAIAKTQGHWGNEPGWGQAIWAAGHAAFPGGEAQRPDFSWKIYDCDSTVIPPKSKSKVRPCDREGWKGCWVLRLQSSFAPAIWNALTNPENPTPLNDKDAVRPGYVIQVVGTVKGNTGSSPGVYLNHNAVGLRAYLPEIITRGVDVKGKFGGAVPAGASTMPTAAAIPAGAPPAAPGAPAAVPAAPAVPAAAPAAPAPAAAPTAVVPAPAVMGIPTAPAAPSAPPAPAAAPAASPPPVTRPPHKGIPLEGYFAQGWTIEQLRADGYTG